MSDQVVMKDFSISLENKPFRVDPDVFHVYPMIPAFGMQELHAIVRRATAEADTFEKVKIYCEFFRMVMPPADADRFVGRLQPDAKTKPIGLPQLLEIISWILDEYNLRPTRPASPSSSSLESADAGTDSEDGVSPTLGTQTPEDYQPTSS